MSEIYDKNGRPVREGDILKIRHFVGPRRKIYYMYKLAHEIDGKMCGVHIHAIAKDGLSWGNAFVLSDRVSHLMEIVEGFGPGDDDHYESRERVRRVE